LRGWRKIGGARPHAPPWIRACYICKFAILLDWKIQLGLHLTKAIWALKRQINADGVTSFRGIKDSQVNYTKNNWLYGMKLL
jgi:hypothetical protein